MKEIHTPISDEDISSLNAGDMLKLSGFVFCGRDAVLPRIVKEADEAMTEQLRGCVIFHTAFYFYYKIRQTFTPLCDILCISDREQRANQYKRW